MYGRLGVWAISVVIPLTCVPTADLAAQGGPFLRLTAGTLNPSDPFATTLAYGAAMGLRFPRLSILGQVTVQSRNRHSGRDLTDDARTFVLLGVERARRARDASREAFLRVTVGALFRAPYATAAVTGAAVGWRFRLGTHWWLVGTVADEIAWLPREEWSCLTGYPYALPGTCGVGGQPQSNFGGIVALERCL